MRSLAEVISDVIDSDPAAEFDAMADRVFKQMGCPARWAAVFHPLLRDEVRRHHRTAMVAALSTRGDGQDGLATKLSHAVASGRVAWLDATIETFGEWGRVAFGAMTVEMHESRIAYQQKLRGSIQTDVDRHVDAINEIKAAGVSCLDDIHRPIAAKGAA